jgi:hypothetical protein
MNFEDAIAVVSGVLLIIVSIVAAVRRILREMRGVKTIAQIERIEQPPDGGWEVVYSFKDDKGRKHEGAIHPPLLKLAVGEMVPIVFDTHNPANNGRARAAWFSWLITLSVVAVGTSLGLLLIWRSV